MSSPTRDEFMARLEALSGRPDFIDRANDIVREAEFTVPVQLPTVEELIAATREVLWHLDGDHVLGMEPGGFHAYLITAMCHADQENLTRFAASFPAMTTVVHTYKFDPNGVTILRSMADYPFPKTPDDNRSSGTPKGN